MKNIPLALRQAKNMFGQDSPWLPLLVLTLPAPDNTVFRILPNNEDVVFPAKVNSGGNATFARTGTAWSPSTGASVATGVPRFEPTGVMVEEASTNLFLNNIGTAAVTRIISVTTANSGKWTCSVEGSGTVTSSAGTATATGYGAATASAVNTITVTGNGTVTYTVTGADSTTKVNVENKAYKTSIIVTGGTSVTRNAETLTIPTSGILNNTEGYIGGFVNLKKTSNFVTVFSTLTSNASISTILQVVYFNTGLLLLQVGTGATFKTVASIATSEGSHHVAVGWKSSTGLTTLAIDGVRVATDLTGYSITFGSTFGIGCRTDGTFQLNNTINKVYCYTRLLSDSEFLSVKNDNAPKDFSAYYPLTTALTKYIPGDTYTAFPVQIELPNETSKGEIPSITLQVSNVTRVLQGHLEALNGGVGATVKLIIINTAHLDEDYAELTMDFEVLSATCNNMWVSLKCGASNPLRRRFPLDKFFASHCSWQFKSVECAYGGADATCDRNITACRAKNNAHRFGGFPGLEPGGLRLA